MPLLDTVAEFQEAAREKSRRAWYEMGAKHALADLDIEMELDPVLVERLMAKLMADFDRRSAEVLARNSDSQVRASLGEEKT